MVLSRKCYLSIASLLCLSWVSAWGIEGNWETPLTGMAQWYNAPSWSSRPNIPGSTSSGGDIANFFLPTTPALVVVEDTQPVVLGTLNYNVPSRSGPVDTISPRFLTMKGMGSLPASINNVGGQSLDLGRNVSGSHLNIESPLFIDIVGNTYIGMYYNLVGNHPVTITGEGPTTLTTGPHLLLVPFDISIDTGPLTLNNVRLELWNNTVVKGDVIVNPGAFLFPNSSNGLNDNHFAPTSNVTVNGGQFLLNGSFVQAFNSLTLDQGGQAFNGRPADTLPRIPLLTLNSSTVALNMKGGSFLISNLFLPNGGAIAYTPSLPGSGEAVIGGLNGISIDLGGHNVQLAIGGGVSLSQIDDMVIHNATFVNGGLTKTLSGTVLFQGMTTMPSLTINQGSVLAGRAVTDVMTVGTNGLTVNPGGALGGFGQLGTGTMAVNNHGLVEPGSNGLTGTLTIAGNYIQHPNGTLLIKVAGRTSDRLVVTGGGVNLLGGTLRVEGDSHNFQNGDRVLIVDNRLGTGVSGTFQRFMEHISDDLLVKFVVQPREVFLEFFPSPEPEIGDAEMTQIALVDRHNLNLLTRLRAVRDRFDTVEWREDLPLSAQADTPKRPFAFKGNRLNTKDIIAVEPEAPIRSGRYWKKPADYRASMYIAPLGSWGEVDRIKVQRGFDFHSYGGILGGDYAFHDAGVGAYLGYERLKGTVDCQFGDFDYGMLFGQVYGTFLPLKNRNLFLDLILGGTRSWYTFNRQSGCLIATGKPKGWDWDGYAGLGYDFHFHKEWRLTPIVGVQYIHLQMDSFLEEGACDENLCIAAQKMHSTRSWVGMSFGGKLNRASVTWVPEVRGYWQHEFAPLSHCVTVTSPCFDFCDNLRVFTGDRNYGIVGAELRALLGQRKHWSLAGAYDYYWSRSTRINFAYLELGYNW